MDSIQSVDSAATARFFCGPKPGHSRSTITRAPCACAMAAVPSVLPPSITTISSANATDSRHCASRVALLSAMIATPRLGRDEGRNCSGIALLSRQKEREYTVALLENGPAQRLHFYRDVGRWAAIRATLARQVPPLLKCRTCRTHTPPISTLLNTAPSIAGLISGFET